MGEPPSDQRLNNLPAPAGPPLTIEERIRYWSTKRNSAAQAKKRALDKGDDVKASQAQLDVDRAKQDFIVIRLSYDVI